MTWIDLLSTSLGNLWRRKVRSFLTLLGVAIGITSIIVLVSLGIAAEENTIAQIAEYDDITQIYVNKNYGGIYIEEDSDTNAGPLLEVINDDVIDQINQIEHVVMASPQYWFSPPYTLKMKIGRYEHPWLSITAVKPGFLEALGYEPEYGEFFTQNNRRLEMVLTPTTMLEFVNPRRQEEWVDYYALLQNGEPLPYKEDIDWENGRFQLYAVESVTDEATGAYSEKESRIKNFSVIGTIKATQDMGYNIPYGVYVDIDALIDFMKRDKKTYKDTLEALEKDGYDTVLVKADNFENVEGILDALKELGLPNTNSPMAWIESSRQSIRNIQMLLGGISAISLLVAALSIANTMMMSIYERTREIGVMKVLGCSMGNIRAMFLMEAGFIGAFGGGIGVGLSYLLSYMMNEVEGISAMITEFIGMADALGANVSAIPLWLSMGALSFGVAVALLSGIYPSQRAMWLSPLAAIRNE